MNKSTAFVVVAATLFALLMGSNIPTPLYEVYRREWLLSPFVMSGVFALYPLTLVSVSWSCGRLSDRFGRRPIVLASLLACAAGSVSFLIASAPGWLFAARAAQGVAVGLAGGAGGAALVELEPHGNRRRAALAASLMLSSGGAVAPLLSGLLAQYAPYPLALPYIVHLALLAPLIAFALFLPETAPRIAGTSWLPRVPQLPRASRAGFAIASLTAGQAWMVVGVFYSLVPSYLHVELGTRSLALAGIVPFVMLGVSAVVQVTLRGRDRPLMFASYGLLTAGMAAVVLAVPFNAVWLVALGALVTGAGHGYGVLGSQSAVTRIAPPAMRGEVFSLFFAIFFLMVGVCVLSLGAIASARGFFFSFLVFGVLIAVLSTSLTVALSRDRSL